MPIKIVMIHPPGSLPGMISLAITPAISPNTNQERISMAFSSIARTRAARTVHSTFSLLVAFGPAALGLTACGNVVVEASGGGAVAGSEGSAGSGGTEAGSAGSGGGDTI